MLVTFRSSETGELFMFAEVAGTLLKIMGKETTARGVFVREEMLPAAECLRQAIADSKVPQDDDDEDDPASKKKVVVTLAQRAWPLMDMLQRTARARGDEPNIVWEAAQDF